MPTFALFKRYKRKRIAPDHPEFAGQPWEFKFTFRGQEFWRTLERDLPKAEAQTRAGALYATITAEIAAERYCRAEDKTKITSAGQAKLGDIFPLYAKHAACARHTIVINLGSLRIVLRKGLGRELSDAAILNLPLDTITRKLGQDFKDNLLTEARGDFVREQRAKVNANAYLRQAKSVFASRPNNNMLERYKAAGQHVPACVLEFKATPLFPRQDHTFRPPKPDLIARLHAAAKELKITDPDVYKAYLLAYGCGLRRKEIIFLCGSWFHHETAPDGTPRHAIEFCTRPNFFVKNYKTKWVPVEDYIWRELVELKPTLAAAAADDLQNFVLDGTSEYARFEVFRRLGAWMKSLGWDRNKKAHDLRKLYSSINGARFGADVTCKLVGNSREVFDGHYSALLNLPAVRMFGQ